MDAREVIVAQAVANAELMADRDRLRNENEALQAKVTYFEARENQCQVPEPSE